MLIRMLDEGRPVYAFPGPWRFVASAARNNLAIMFVPLVLILAWSESLDRLLPTLIWPASGGNRAACSRRRARPRSASPDRSRSSPSCPR
jgi:hypothetical protein